MPSQADSRNLHPVGGAPTGTRVVSVRDVAIVPTGTDDAPVEDYRDHRPVDGFDLGHGVSIERLSDADYELMMAACVLFTLPVTVLFFLAQRAFVEGVTVTGVKG